MALAAGVTWAAFFGLGRARLCEPAEGLSADIAQNMVTSGDWVVPHHNGHPYVDKPPLFFWVTAVGLRLFGDGEFAARSGVAAVGLLEVALLYLLGSLLYGRVAGLLSAAVLATSVGHLVFGRLMMVDAAFSTCLTATFLCFALGWVDERRRFLWWTLCGASAGLAVLAKSLIGGVLPCVTIGAFLLATRQWRVLRQRAFAGAVLGFLALAVPWHVLMSLRVPAFAHYYFWNEQWLRFLGRRAPADYTGVPLAAYLTSPWVWAVPWSFFLPQMIWSARRAERGDGTAREQLARLLPWLWLATVVGFFALARGRLYYYSLPSLPAFALLTGRMWGDLGRHDGKGFRRSLALAMAAMGASAPVVIVVFRRIVGPLVPPAILHEMLSPAVAIGWCLAAGGLLGALALLLGRDRIAFAAMFAGVLASVVPISGMFVAFARFASLGTLAESVHLSLTPDDVVVHRFVRDDNSELPFYLHHPVRVLKRPGELHQPIAGGAGGYYIEQDEFARLWRSPRPVFLFVSQPALPAQSAEPLPPHAIVLARDLDARICCNEAAARRFRTGRAATGGGSAPAN